VLKNAERPFTAILGGAKVSDKIMIIENLFNAADNVIIGGGMAYTFLRAQGHQVGASLCEYDKLDLANELIAKAKEKGVQLLIPIDSKVASAFANDAETKIVDNSDIPETMMGLDIGDKAMKQFSDVIKNSKTILWNGPMGVFEMSNFESGTKAIADAVVAATANGAFSLVGGGDSVAAVNKYSIANKLSYVSTGGGAMLEFFEGKELPGIKAVRN
jgi:phosphoglycerate kinase